MPDGTTRDPRWGDYQGTGIWRPCPDCGALHEIDEDLGFRALLETLCTTVGQSSAEISDAFDIGRTGGRWTTNDAEALFSFTTASGRLAVAPYGVVASWNAQNHSWMWAWGFPEGWCQPPALAVAQMTFDEGTRKGWEAATSRLLCVNQHEAWHLTKLAAHVADLPLVYRAPVNDKNWHYFAIGRPAWVS